MAPTRSPIFTKPAPLPLAPLDSNPAPSSETSKNRARFLPHVDFYGGFGAGVLAGVLECLEAAEVDRRLHLGEWRAQPRGIHLGGQGGRPAAERRASSMPRSASKGG